MYLQYMKNFLKITIILINRMKLFRIQKVLENYYFNNAAGNHLNDFPQLFPFLS